MGFEVTKSGFAKLGPIPYDKPTRPFFLGPGCSFVQIDHTLVSEKEIFEL